MANESQYTSLAPSDQALNPEIKSFFEAFYQISDTPTEEAHSLYASQYFTTNATLIMVSKRAVGTEEILAIRKGMWTAVKERSHNPVKIFPFGNTDEEGRQELMLYGDVAYVFKDGRAAKVDWAARAVLVKKGGNWKMSFYQVYLDSAAMENAK